MNDSGIGDVLARVEEQVRRAGNRLFGGPGGNGSPPPSSGDPPRSTRIPRAGAFILRVFLILVGAELLGALIEGVSSGRWERLGMDLIVAGLLFIAWDRIIRVTRRKREEYRRRVEGAGEKLRLWDALVFSLLWTEEIYGDIPADRRRFVGIAYTLIALGLIVAFARIGEGLLGLVLAGSLVLAAVNLLGWMVSRERGERDSLATELRLARTVQLSLMPARAPDVPGLAIAGASVPATDVGGDHFDYLVHPGTPPRLGVAVVDVSGKGIQAAMSAVFTSGAFRADGTDSPAEVLTRLNRTIHGSSPRGHFVAFLYGVVDPGARTFTFANAGQVKPLLLRAGAPEALDARGVTFALGMTPDAAYTNRIVPVQAGDTLLLLTDGIVETMDHRQDPFGDERLFNLLRSPRCASAAPADLIGAILAAVDAHAGGTPRNDDRTIVAIGVL